MRDMGPATLGGVSGAGEIISRPRSRLIREYRGTFFFGSRDEAALTAMCRHREQVEFEGTIDGENKTMSVRLTSVLPGTGMAFFEGAGDSH